jgi:hypothetical protein
MERGMNTGVRKRTSRGRTGPARIRIGNRGPGNHLRVINKAPLLCPLPPNGDEKVARQLIGLLVAAVRDPAPVSEVYDNRFTQQGVSS